MARAASTIIEYRNYHLPAHFPVLLLSGDRWHISDVPSDVLHFHNCMEIGFCETNTGVLKFEETPYDFAAGDITIISGDLPHTTYSTEGTASKWSYLFLDPEELLRPFFPLDSLPNSSLFRNLLHNYANIFSKNEHSTIYNLAHTILCEMQNKPLNYEVSVRGLTLALLTHIMREGASNSALNAKTSMPISPALHYINTNYMESFTMDDLASLCMMSSSHFRKIFTTIMGIGPLEHLNCIRISKACRLLRMTEDSVLNISEQVGFRSLSSFNRHFLADMGESPTVWRRKINLNKDVSILKYSGWLSPPVV